MGRAASSQACKGHLGGHPVGRAAPGFTPPGVPPQPAIRVPCLSPAFPQPCSAEQISPAGQSCGFLPPVPLKSVTPHVSEPTRQQFLPQTPANLQGQATWQPQRIPRLTALCLCYQRTPTLTSTAVFPSIPSFSTPATEKADKYTGGWERPETEGPS